MPIEILPVDRQTVFAATNFKAVHPVAYPGSFAIVAAQSYDGLVLTGDPEFEAVKDIIWIERIGESSNA